VPTTGLADIAIGDPHPLEPGGLGQHLAQQVSVARLQFRPLREGMMRLRDPGGQIVADPLELSKIEDLRGAGAGRHRAVELESRERLSEKRRQLPLETADLPSQLSASSTLVDPIAKRRENVALE
jgi:hypothetical protein